MTLFGEALTLLARVSPRMTEDERRELEVLLDQAGECGRFAWTRAGDQIDVTFPHGAIHDLALDECQVCNSLVVYGDEDDDDDGA